MENNEPCSYYGRQGGKVPKIPASAMVLDNHFRETIDEELKRFKKELSKMFKTLKDEFIEDLKVAKKKINILEYSVKDLDKDLKERRKEMAAAKEAEEKAKKALIQAKIAADKAELAAIKGIEKGKKVKGDDKDKYFLQHKDMK